MSKNSRHAAESSLRLRFYELARLNCCIHPPQTCSQELGHFLYDAGSIPAPKY